MLVFHKQSNRERSQCFGARSNVEHCVGGTWSWRIEGGISEGLGTDLRAIYDRYGKTRYVEVVHETADAPDRCGFVEPRLHVEAIRGRLHFIRHRCKGPDGDETG